MQEKDQGGAGKPVEQGDERSALTAFDTENPGAGEDAASGGDASPDALPERKSGEPDKAAAQDFDTGGAMGTRHAYTPAAAPFAQIEVKPPAWVQKAMQDAANAVAGPSPEMKKILQSIQRDAAIGADLAARRALREMQQQLSSRMKNLADRILKPGEDFEDAYWRVRRERDSRRLEKWGENLKEYRKKFGGDSRAYTQPQISRHVFEQTRDGASRGNRKRLGYIESAARSPITLPELFRLADAYEAPPMLIIGETTEDEEKLLELYRKMDDTRKRYFLGLAADSAAQAIEDNADEDM